VKGWSLELFYFKATAVTAGDLLTGGEVLARVREGGVVQGLGVCGCGVWGCMRPGDEPIWGLLLAPYPSSARICASALARNTLMCPQIYPP
jgi:hypothetical protein